MTDRTMSSWVAILGGLVLWLIIGATGLAVLRLSWPAYALAEPIKAYSFTMMIARLSVALICSIVAGAVTARISGSRTAAWWVGLVLLIGSAPLHLVLVWADYPPWYHAAYLLPLIPVTGLSGVMVNGDRSRLSQR